MNYYFIQHKGNYKVFFNATAMEWVSDVGLATKFHLDNKSTAECLSMQVNGVLIEAYCPI